MADFKFGRGRLQYARGVFYRQELFDKSIQQAEAELEKATPEERESEDGKKYIQEIADTKQGFVEYNRKKKLEDAQDYVVRKIKYAKGQGSRFMDRVEKSHEEVKEKLKELRDDDSFKGDVEVMAWADEREKEMEAYLDELAVEGLKKKVDEHKDWLERQLKYA